MQSYPTLALKHEIINSFTNTLNQINKEESDNLSMLVRRAGKLYFKIKENSNLIGLLKEFKDSKGKIIRDNLFKFLNQNRKIIINSPEIIKMLSKYKIFDKLNTPIIPEKDEENEKCSENPKNRAEQNLDIDNNSNEFCEQQLSIIDNYNETFSSLGNNKEFHNLIPEDYLQEKETELDTKETENNTKSEKDETKELIKSIDEFSKERKLFSLNDSIDTLICDINLVYIEKYLQYSNNKDWISPKVIEKYFYIPLPNWANTCKSFDFNSILFIIIELILLLNYQFFQLKGKNFSDIRNINDKYEGKINNINNLKTFLIKYYPNNIEFFFLPNVLKSTSNIAAQSYLDKYNIQKIEYKKNLPYFFEQIFIRLKTNLEQYSKNEEKIEMLFEKITYYTFDDKLYVKYLIYSSFLTVIFQYVIEQLSDDLSPKILDIYNKISHFKPTWVKIRNYYVNTFLSQIYNLLIDDYYFRFHYYGSSTTGLDNIGSDIDIMISYIPKKKVYVDFLSNLSQKLKLLKQKYNYMKINPILEAKVPIIKIDINLSEKVFNMNDEEKKEVFSLFNKEDVTTIKIDISSTYNLKTIENIYKMTSLINYELNNYPIIRPVVSYLKFYLKKYKMDSVKDGWPSPSSIFLMIRNIVKTYIKEYPLKTLNVGKVLILFLVKFSNYNFDYLIDKDGYDKPYIQCDKEDKKFFITNPIETDKNVFPNPKKIKEIQKCFAQILKDIIQKREIPF